MSFPTKVSMPESVFMGSYLGMLLPNSDIIVLLILGFYWDSRFDCGCFEGGWSDRGRSHQ